VDCQLHVCLFLRPGALIDDAHPARQLAARLDVDMRRLRLDRLGPGDGDDAEQVLEVKTLDAIEA